MTYNETIDYLYNAAPAFTKVGASAYKEGLSNTLALDEHAGHPHRSFLTIHVAGTNGKGSCSHTLAAILQSAETTIRGEKRKLRVGLFTSPHMVTFRERIRVNGEMVSEQWVVEWVERNRNFFEPLCPSFFELCTAMAFEYFREQNVDIAVIEVGLGGRLDATNICVPELCVITKIGLDHCDWLGDTVEKIAAEKAGIIKPGVPVVLAKNEPSVRAVVEARAKEVGAPFRYAPDLATEDEIPADFPLAGSFNRENAVTALAALKTLGAGDPRRLADVVWPGRFQRVGNFIVDGAHNPPACEALVRALGDARDLDLIAGFCGDKDADAVLRMLAPRVKKGFAVRTNNPRSLSADVTAAKMRAAGIDAVSCPSLRAAIESASDPDTPTPQHPNTLICGSLFLAGEALVELGAYPWPAERFDPSELLKV